MRFRSTLFALFFAIGSFVVPAVAHAAIPFFGPIIPTEYAVCPASWGLLITVINKIISFLLTLIIVFIMPIMIAYSGFLLVVNQGNSSKLHQAKSILTNTVMGLVIALAAWMIVDALMAVLYNPSTVTETWTSLISSGGIPPCLPQAGALPDNGLNTASGLPTITTGTGGASIGGALPLCSSTNPACSPSALQQAGISQTQANIMSCIAMTESSGVAGTPSYNVTHPGSNSTACGTFQITQTTWKKNASGSCTNFSSCTDAVCNLQVAQTLVSKNGYTDWTCANCNAKAQSCVTTYGP